MGFSREFSWTGLDCLLSELRWSDNQLLPTSDHIMWGHPIAIHVFTKTLFFFLFFLPATSIALPVISSLAMMQPDSVTKSTDTSVVRRSAVQLTGGKSLGNGWSFNFLQIIPSLPAAIAVNNLEHIYDSVMQLSQPGATSSPLHNRFAFPYGDLEIILQSVNPALAVPWDLVYSFATDARARTALGFVGLFSGYLKNAAGQTVLCALRLRTIPSATGNSAGNFAG